MIIIDLGSGNSCLNRWDIAKEMIHAIASIDTHREEVVLKWQLFEKAEPNLPLQREIFKNAYLEAWGLGYDTTASVGDVSSLDYLLRFNKPWQPLPFVKLACRPELYHLADRVPENIRVIKSVASSEQFSPDCLCCVREYPANAKQYKKIFQETQLKQGISDHTTDWYLYKKYNPELYEVHFKLPNMVGFDSGEFARMPSQLKEIL
jgi:hypothetical protein